MVIFVDIYAHPSRENVWSKGEQIGLKDDALRLFSFAANEVKLTLQVDVDTGEAIIVAVDDRLLQLPKTA